MINQENRQRYSYLMKWIYKINAMKKPIYIPLLPLFIGSVIPILVLLFIGEKVPDGTIYWSLACLFLWIGYEAYYRLKLKRYRDYNHL